MPVIDAHCHLVHGDDLHTRYTPSEIVRAMDAAGVERSIVFAMSVTTAESIRLAARARDEFPDRLVPYAYGLPSFDDSPLELIRRALADGFRGIKVHSGECPVSERTHVPLMELAEDAGVPVLVDVCGRHREAEWMLSRFGGATIVIAHIGRYRCTEEHVMDRFIELAAAHPRAVLDVSGVVLPWKIADAVRAVGADRVVWGSDGPSPSPDTASFLRSEIAKIHALGLSASDTDRVLALSIERLWATRRGGAPGGA
jgi:predicted TIM-barrel fold metal-dependent hydrolase